MRTMRWLGLVLLLAVPGGFLVGQEKKSEEKPAVLIVKLLDDANVIIDDEKMGGSGTERRYSTPPLEVGKRYYYIVQSHREPNNYTNIWRTRKVFVKAGETTTVDLTGPDDPKQPDVIKIRYVPTPHTVVKKMLELAKCGKDDVVFDIGCGDGRMVIAGVKDSGAKRGVGVDIDPERIKESTKNAKDAGVADKIEFRLEDALKIKDLEDASVLLLYLGDDLMEQLRPIFKKRLKPGTRIVSHRFKWDEKDWKADKITPITAINDYGDNENFRLLLWVVPEKGKDTKKDD